MLMGKHSNLDVPRIVHVILQTQSKCLQNKVVTKLLSRVCDPVIV